MKSLLVTLFLCTAAVLAQYDQETPTTKSILPPAAQPVNESSGNKIDDGLIPQDLYTEGVLETTDHEASGLLTEESSGLSSGSSGQILEESSGFGSESSGVLSYESSGFGSGASGDSPLESSGLESSGFSLDPSAETADNKEADDQIRTQIRPPPVPKNNEKKEPAMLRAPPVSKAHVKKPEVDEDPDMRDVMANLENLAEKSGVACPSDVLFVVDSTNSIKELFEEHKTYVLKVLEGLSVSEAGDHVGVILFSGPHRQREKIKLGSTVDNAKLVKQIHNLPFLSGITATGAALNFAKSSLDARRFNVQTSVVVITDGFSYDLIEAAAKQLRGMRNVRVFAVTIGESYVQDELEMIAGSPDRVLKGPTSYGRLVQSIKECAGGRKIVQKVETATVHYVPTATDASGRHLIPNPRFTDQGVYHFDTSKSSNAKINPMTTTKIQHVSKINPAATTKIQHVSKINPTTPTKIQLFDSARRSDQPRLSCLMDVVFVFDASGSLSERFTTQLDLANKLIEKFAIGPEDTQVAAIKYAGKKKSRVLFNLNATYDKTDLKKKILKTSFMSGTTYTNEALVKAAELLKGPGGRLNKATPLVIVFTDGFSGESPAKGAEALHKLGANVYAIGIDGNSNTINHSELKVIAGDEHRIYLTSNFANFVNDVDAMRRKCLAKKRKNRI